MDASLPPNCVTTLAPLRVLLAEDHPVNQKLAVALLGKRGHDVVVVEDGVQAVSAWERERFDAILMDVHMPTMGGLEATRAIRERERGGAQHVPIVALTALALSSDRDRCFAAGMDAFVSKPLTAAELFSTLERLLPQKRLAKPADEPRRSGAVDAARLLASVEGDEAMLHDLVETFLAEQPRQEQTIAEALAHRDAAAVARAAHGFKGVLLTMAAMPAADCARKLEMIARSTRLDEAFAAHAELRAELARVEPELRALLRRAA